MHVERRTLSGVMTRRRMVGSLGALAVLAAPQSMLARQATPEATPGDAEAPGPSRMTPARPSSCPAARSRSRRISMPPPRSGTSGSARRRLPATPWIPTPPGATWTATLRSSMWRPVRRCRTWRPCWRRISTSSSRSTGATKRTRTSGASPTLPTTSAPTPRCR